MNKLLVRGVRRTDYSELANVIEVWRPRDATKLRDYPKQVKPEENLIALLDGQIVGWLEGHHAAQNWIHLDDFKHHDESWRCSYVRKLFVAGTVRRNGVGSALMLHFLDDARAADNKLITLTLDAHNDEKNLEAFYGKLGFTYGKDSRQPDGRSGYLVKQFPESGG